jgi:tetratricopeptide (TPR) repeat protein
MTFRRPFYRDDGRRAMDAGTTRSSGAGCQSFIVHNMLRISTLCLALLLTAGSLPRSVGAQQLQQEQLSKFQLAQNHLRSGQNERAITLLEDLHDQAPRKQVVYSKLKKAYTNVKRYDDAIALVEKRLSGRATPALMSEKARLLYLKGDQEAADETWDKAVKLAPDKRSTYRVVYHSLVKNRLFTRAIDVLERGREALGRKGAFRQNMARLYGLTGKHEKAIGEYLALIKNNKDKLSFAKNRLGRNTGKEAALKQYLAGTQSAVREKPLYRPYRELLAWLHTEAEQYGKALDAVRAIDRLEKAQGRPLYEFARRMSRAGAYDVALEAYREILNRHPNAALAPEARYGLALMREKWAEKHGERASSDGDAAHYEKARDAYRAFLEKHPHHAKRAKAMRRLGRLQQDVFRDFDAAEATLEDVIRRFPDSDAANQAQYDLGRLALQRGNLADAKLAFSRLAEDLHSGELAQKARYQLALLHLYRGEFETASSMAKVLNQNTSRDVANDAIRLKVLLAENKGPDSTNTALRTYARARLLKRRHRHDKALQTLDSLTSTAGRHPLIDEARFLRAQTLRAADRPKEALTAFQQLPMMHPRSPFADRSLFQSAQLRERELDEPQAALKAYEKLLTTYPGSLLASEARARIRALRAENKEAL